MTRKLRFLLAFVLLSVAFVGGSAFATPSASPSSSKVPCVLPWDVLHALPAPAPALKFADEIYGLDLDEDLADDAAYLHTNPNCVGTVKKCKIVIKDADKAVLINATTTKPIQTVKDAVKSATNPLGLNVVTITVVINGVTYTIDLYYKA